MLIGIDPDAQMEVDLGGAKFTIGVVPSSAWQRIKYKGMHAFDQAKRTAIAACMVDGKDPEEVLRTADEATGMPSVQRYMVRALGDPEYKAAMVPIMTEVARWAVKGHSGFVKPDKTPVPFTTVRTTHEGESVEVVSPETLKWYKQHVTLLTSIYNAAHALNELGAAEKKA